MARARGNSTAARRARARSQARYVTSGRFAGGAVSATAARTARASLGSSVLTTGTLATARAAAEAERTSESESTGK